MGKILLKSTIVVLFLFHFKGIAYGQQFDWAKKAGYYAYDYGHGVSTDDSGNVYMAGKFEMDGKFDSLSIPSAGNHDMFVTKYDRNGALQWVRTFGGVWGDYAHASTSDRYGNVYVTGEFEVTSTFGGTNTSLTTNGSNDIFLAKYNTNGELLWGKKAGGKKSDQGLAVAVNEDAIYLAGKFKDTAYFDNFQLISKGDDDIFIAKYTHSGTVLWAKQAGGAYEDEAFGISISEDEFIYITGHFDIEAQFETTALVAYGQSDIFLAKYDSNGNLIWVRKAGSTADDQGNEVLAGKDGRIYITGGFREYCQWDHLNMWGNLGDLDIFIACYTSDGTVVWIKKAGGDINDEAYSIDMDNDFNLYITGYYGNSGKFDNTFVTAADSADIFVASYTANGDLRWVLSPGGGKDSSYLMGTEEAGRSICVANSGQIFVSGSFRTNAIFGGTTLTGWMHADAFVGSISQASTLTATLVASGKTTLCSGETVKLNANFGGNYSYEWYKNGTLISGISTSSFLTSQPGTYVVKISLGGNFMISNSISISSLENTVAAYSYTLDGFNLSLNNTSINSTVSLWDFGDGTLSQDLNPFHTFILSGNYTICLISYNACGSDTSCKSIVIDDVGMEYLLDENHFSLYPNPAANRINLQCSKIEKGELNYKVIALTGQVLLEKSNAIGNKSALEINLTNIPAGIYFLQVRIGDKQQVKKFTIN